MRYFIPMGKNEIVSCPDGVGFKCPGKYYAEREDAQEELDSRKVELPLSDEERYFLDREFETETIDSLFKLYEHKRPKSNDEIISAFAQVAVKLAEGRDGNGLQ